MPQSRVFTNKDLNKPITNSKSKTFTNKDLVIDEPPPDIMDEPSDIEDTPPDIMDDEAAAPNTVEAISSEEPDTWMEGFTNSVLGGDALRAGLEGAKGFAKGAILDIPESIIGGIKGAYNAVTNPIETIRNLPSNISEGMRSIYDTTRMAGSNPESFGRMMGQMTGQPLVTAGLAKGAPSVIRGTGAVAEKTGNIMRRHAPLTGMPIVSPLAGRNLTRLERMTGRGIEAVGKKMKEVGKPKIKTIDGKVVDPVDLEGMELQPGQTITSERIPISKNNLTNQLDEVLALEEGQQLPPIKPKKPKVRPNPDGTFTNLDTGEVFDSKGRPMAVSNVKEGKTIDKNSPFFVKNRK